MSLDSIQLAVADAVQDKDGALTQDAHGRAIAAAVQQYSVDRPRVRVADLLAPGGAYVPTPDDWSVNLSRLNAVEFPIGDSPATMIPLRNVEQYASPDGIMFRCLGYSFPAGAALRVTYTAKHRLTVDEDSIPEEHALGVAHYAASLLCGQLASHYATESAPTIAADTTDHRGKTERFASRALELRADYFRIVGVIDRGTKAVRAASATVELASRDQFGDRRMFHPPQRRSGV